MKRAKTIGLSVVAIATKRNKRLAFKSDCIVAEQN